MKVGEEMLDSFTYRTVLTAREILGELYTPDTKSPWCLCEIVIPDPGKEPGSMGLYIKRLFNEEHAFEGANLSRTYRTVAKLEPCGPEFGIDVKVSYRNNNTEGAEIAFSEEGLNLALRDPSITTGC